MEQRGKEKEWIAEENKEVPWKNQRQNQKERNEIRAVGRKEAKEILRVWEKEKKRMKEKEKIEI